MPPVTAPTANLLRIRSEHPTRMRILSERSESKDLSCGAKSPIICTSVNLLPQFLCNPHLQEPCGSAGNSRLTAAEFAHFTLLESTLARALRKCGKQTPYKSIGIRTCENCACNLFRIRTYKNRGGGVMLKQAHDSLSCSPCMRHNPRARGSTHTKSSARRIQ
jgi:hypothetical protein